LAKKYKQIINKGQTTHDGISGAGNVIGMLAAVVGTGLLRLRPPGGTGAGRSGTEAAAAVVDVRGVDAGRCPMLQHTQPRHNPVNHTLQPLSSTKSL